MTRDPAVEQASQHSSASARERIRDAFDGVTPHEADRVKVRERSAALDRRADRFRKSWGVLLGRARRRRLRPDRRARGQLACENVLGLESNLEAQEPPALEHELDDDLGAILVIGAAARIALARLNRAVDRVPARALPWPDAESNRGGGLRRLWRTGVPEILLLPSEGACARCSPA